MARGYPGAFGRSVNSPWIWVTLCVLFVLPFVNLRRPLCWLHADLLALVGFSVSLRSSTTRTSGSSVPLTYPAARLPARAAAVDRARSRARAPPSRCG